MRAPGKVASPLVGITVAVHRAALIWHILVGASAATSAITVARAACAAPGPWILSSVAHLTYLTYAWRRFREQCDEARCVTNDLTDMPRRAAVAPSVA